MTPPSKPAPPPAPIRFPPDREIVPASELIRQSQSKRKPSASGVNADYQAGFTPCAGT